MARVTVVDLGAYAVKVAVFTEEDGVLQLADDVVRTVPQDGAGMPTMADRLAIMDTIFSDHDGLRSGVVLSSWPAEATSIHRMNLPFDDPKQIEQVLPFEVESVVPFDVDEMSMVWRPVHEDKPGNLIVAMARSSRLGEFLSEMKSRSLDPRHVYVDAASDQSLAYDRGVCAVVDVGHESTNVTVTQNGVSVYFRSLSVGGAAFTRAIQESLDCTWAEATEIKHGAPVAEMELTQEGPLLPPAGDEVDSEEEQDTAPDADLRRKLAADAIQMTLKRFLSSVRATLIRAEDELRISIGDVFLTGGGSLLVDLKDALEEDLGVSIRLPAHERKPIEAELGSIYAMALTSRAEKHRDALDLRTGEFEFRGGMGLTKTVLSYGGAGLGAFLVAALVLFGYRYVQLSNQLDSLQEQLNTEVAAAFPALAGQNFGGSQSVSLFTGELEDASLQLSLLGDGKSAPRTLETIQAVSNAFPAPDQVRVDLDLMVVSADIMTMSGETDGYGAVALIEDTLKKTERFSRAEKTDESKTSKGKLKFTISVPFQDGAGEEG